MRLLVVAAVLAGLVLACDAASGRALFKHARNARWSWEPDAGATQVANPPPYWKPGPEWQKSEMGTWYKFPEPGKGDWKKGFCVSKPDVTQAEMSSLSERQWLTDLMWFLGQGCNAGNKYHVRNWEGKGMLDDCVSTVGLVFFDCCFQGKWTVIPREGNEVYAANCEKLNRVRQWWDGVAGESGAAFCVCSQTRDYIRRRMSNFASKLDDPLKLQPPPSISGNEPPAPFSSSYTTPSAAALSGSGKKKNKKNKKDAGAASSGAASSGGLGGKPFMAGAPGAGGSGSSDWLNGGAAQKASGGASGATTDKTNQQTANGKPQQTAVQPGQNPVKTPGGSPGTNANGAQNPVKTPQTSASQTSNSTANGGNVKNKTEAAKPTATQLTNNATKPTDVWDNQSKPQTNVNAASSSGASSTGSGISSGQHQANTGDSLATHQGEHMTIITNDNSLVHKETHMMNSPK